MTLGRPFSGYRALAGLIIAILLLVGAGYLLFNHTDKKLTPANPQNTAVTSINKLVVKDLGVEITLSNPLIGTTTDTTTPPSSTKSTPLPITNFRLIQYSYLVQKCLDAKYNFRTPYASFSKISGKAATGDAQLMKQFNGFYIERIGAGLKLTCKDQTTQASLDDLNIKYDQALKDAFASAQPI